MTASRWTCPYFQVPFDLGQASWVMTVNDARHLPAPLLSRCPPIRLPHLTTPDLTGFARRHGARRRLSQVGIEAIVEAIEASAGPALGGPTVLARLGLVLAAAGLLLAGLSGPVTLAAAALVSAGVGLVVPGLIATIAGVASNANRGLALALYTFLLFVGASLAPPVSTALSFERYRRKLVMPDQAAF